MSVTAVTQLTVSKTTYDCVPPPREQETRAGDRRGLGNMERWTAEVRGAFAARLTCPRQRTHLTMPAAHAPGGVVQRRVLQEPEFLSDAHFLGAQPGGVALFAPGLIAKFDDLICGPVHVFSQRHDALMFHGGEPRHNQIREALAAYRDLPKDWGIAVRAADDRFCRACAAERASLIAIGSDHFPRGAGGA